MFMLPFFAVKAVERHGYSQKDISGYLGLHYTSISRIVNERYRAKFKDLTLLFLFCSGKLDISIVYAVKYMQHRE